MKFEWAALFFLLLWTGEALVRRWAFGQIPTLLDAATIYGLLAVSLGFAAWRMKVLLRERRSRIQKN